MERSNEDLVTVASLPSLSEAEVAKSFLEAAGIAAYVMSGDVIRVDPLDLTRPTEVRLQVLAPDREAARALLEPATNEEPAGDG